jgi:DNA-binding MarR family transcriptional regulator
LAEQTSSLLESSITLQQLRVLLNVYLCGPVPIHDVAETLGSKPNVATGVVQRLVERDLVERHEDPRDRRARLLRTTTRGSKLIEELGTVVQAQRRKLLERLSDPQLEQLRAILEVMAA